MTRTERTQLSDGSYFLIEPGGSSTGVLISREVDGEVVWGQAFAHDTELERVIDDVRRDMAERPEGFLSAQRRGVYCSAERGCDPLCQIKGEHGW